MTTKSYIIAKQSTTIKKKLLILQQLQQLHNMKSPETINKIEAVVLYILQSFKEGVDYIKLFKIMYFAQRKFLATYGMTIFDDTFKARLRGPVPALTYKVVKIAETGTGRKEHKDLSRFVKSIRIESKDGHQMVFATQQPNVEYISAMARKTLDWAVAEYGSKNSDELSELTHDNIYDEVKERMKDDPQKDIFTLIDIARSGGASEAMIEHIREKQIIKNALS